MALRYRNILIIGFSLQGTVLNMISSVFNVVKYNSTMYCNVICTDLPLRLFSTDAFWNCYYFVVI